MDDWAIPSDFSSRNLSTPYAASPQGKRLKNLAKTRPTPTCISWFFVRLWISL